MLNYKANLYFEDRFKNPEKHLIFKFYKNIVSLEQLDELFENKNIYNKDFFKQIIYFLYEKYEQNVLKVSYMTKKYNFVKFKQNRKCVQKQENVIQFLDQVYLLSDLQKVKAFINHLYNINIELKKFYYNDFFLKDLMYVFFCLFLFKQDQWIKIFKKSSKRNKNLFYVDSVFRKFQNRYKQYFIIPENKKLVSETKYDKLIFTRTPKLTNLLKNIEQKNSDDIIATIKKNPLLLCYHFPTKFYCTIFHLSAELQIDQVFFYILKNYKECINLTNKDGNTTFYSAVKSSNLTYIQALVDNGADANHLGKKKANAIYFSIMFGEPKVTKYLINLGININQKNYIGRTPLMKAVYLCKLEKTKMLLACQNIKIQEEDHNMRRALHMTCWGDEGGRKGKVVQNQVLPAFAQGLELLLEYDDDWYFQDRDGNDAIHISCSTRSLECVKIWNKLKADFNRRNNFGETSLMLALRYKNDDIVEYLIDNVDNDYTQLTDINLNCLQYCFKYDLQKNTFLKLIKKIQDQNNYQFIVQSFEQIHGITYKVFFFEYLKTQYKEVQEIYASKIKQNLDWFLFDGQEVECVLEYFIQFLDKKDFKELVKIAFQNNYQYPLTYLDQKSLIDIRNIIKQYYIDILQNIDEKILQNNVVVKLLIDSINLNDLLNYKNEKKENFFVILIKNQKLDTVLDLLIRMNEQQIEQKMIDNILNCKSISGLNIQDYLIKYKCFWLIDHFQKYTQQTNLNYEFLKIEVQESKNLDLNTINKLKNVKTKFLSKERIEQYKTDKQIESMCDLFNQKFFNFENLDMLSFQHNPKFCNSNQDFQICLNDLKEQDLIGVDLEYGVVEYQKQIYRTIPLIQISTIEKTYILDGYKLYYQIKSELKQILESEKILKLIHGCFYDLNLFHQFFQIRISNFFDLQQAYRIYNNNNTSIGLSTLCKEFLNFELDKSLQCSTWNVRPLPQILLKYAALDSIVLLPLFQQFLKKDDDAKTVNQVIRKSNQIYQKVQMEKILLKIKLKKIQLNFSEFVITIHETKEKQFGASRLFISRGQIRSLE